MVPSAPIPSGLAPSLLPPLERPPFERAVTEPRPFELTRSRPGASVSDLSGILRLAPCAPTPNALIPERRSEQIPSRICPSGLAASAGARLARPASRLVRCAPFSFAMPACRLVGSAPAPSMRRPSRLVRSRGAWSALRPSDPIPSALAVRARRSCSRHLIQKRAGRKQRSSVRSCAPQRLSTSGKQASTRS